MKKNLKKTEQNLIKETAKIYQSITRDAADGFWIVDMQGNFLDVNESYCRLIGYSRKKLLKMNIADVEVNEKPKAIIKHLQKIKNKGKDSFFAEHRKNNGKIIDIEISANYANYLDGMVFVFLRDVSKRNRLEQERKKTNESAKNVIAGQLAESYKHLGLVNRKIALLLEIEKYPNSKKDQKEITDHILNLAMNISNAPTGYLYGAEGEGRFNLLAARGIKEEQKEKIKSITTQTVGLLRHLLKEKNILSGRIKQYETELLALDNELEYFVTLPLSRGTTLGGFIFLGFDKKESVGIQDLEFLDVFSLHASNALVKAGVLKWFKQLFNNSLTKIGQFLLFAYGHFLNAVISFILVAAAVFFFVVKLINILVARSKKEPLPDSTIKKCQECLGEIPVGAKRCMRCDQVIEEKQ